MFQSQSKLPLILTSIYLAISILAFILMFVTIESDSLSGIFVVFVAMPWTLLFIPLIDAIGMNSIALNTILMAVGVGINALIIYTLFAFLSRKKITPTLYSRRIILCH